jgi:WD40 repeat protein
MKRQRIVRNGLIFTFASIFLCATAFAHGCDAVAFSPDGKLFAAAFDDGGVTLNDFATRKRIRELKGHTKAVMAVAFSPDGKMLATGGETVRLWNVETGAQLATLDGHTEGFGVWGWLRAVAFSPDGKMLASGGADGTVKVWDIAAKKELRTLGTKSDTPVLTVAFSPDGKMLASGGVDDTVKLWNVATGRQLHNMDADSYGEPRSVVFGPDGKTIYSGNHNAKIVIWDAATGAKTRTLEVRGGSVNSIAFSPDGKLMAVAPGSDLLIFDVAAGAAIQKMPWGGQVNSVAFSRDGKTLLAGVTRGGWLLWDAESGSELTEVTR